MLKIQCVTVDCHNPALLANFWSKALGWKIGEDGDDIGVWIERELPAGDTEGFPDILFLRTPDAKTIKNRLHLDLRPTNQDEEVARLEKLGAKQIEIGQANEPECTWVVMADPEGNEFCVLRAIN